MTGWFVEFFASLMHLSMLSPRGEGQPRGGDLIDITSPRVGILTLWGGEFVIFFIFFICLII